MPVSQSMPGSACRAGRHLPAARHRRRRAKRAGAGTENTASRTPAAQDLNIHVSPLKVRASIAIGIALCLGDSGDVIQDDAVDTVGLLRGVVLPIVVDIAPGEEEEAVFVKVLHQVLQPVHDERGLRHHALAT